MKSGIRVDVETKLYAAAMKKISKDALPGAAADALNAAAVAVRKQSKANVQKELIVRTPYTLNSIRQDRTARGPNLHKMFSRVGSLSPYLPIQDEGGTVKAKRDKLPIPMLAARSGNIKRKIAKRYQAGQYGDKKKFFVGVPRGGGRPLGVWERTRNNKRLRRIRNLEESRVRLKPTRWFSAAVQKYGNQQYITAAFIKSAKRRLRNVAG